MPYSHVRTLASTAAVWKPTLPRTNRSAVTGSRRNCRATRTRSLARDPNIRHAPRSYAAVDANPSAFASPAASTTCTHPAAAASNRSIAAYTASACRIAAIGDTGPGSPPSRSAMSANRSRSNAGWELMFELYGRPQGSATCLAGLWITPQGALD